MGAIVAGSDEPYALQTGTEHLALEEDSGLPVETVFRLDCYDFESEGDTDDDYTLVNNSDDKPSVTVGVEYNTVEIDSFLVTEGEISVPTGQTHTVTLKWETSYADSCTASGNPPTSAWSNGVSTANTSIQSQDISICGPGASGCDFSLGAGATETYSFQLQCTRTTASETSTVTRGPLSVEATQPSFFVAATVPPNDETTVNTVSICESGSPNTDVVPSVNEPISVNIAPQNDTYVGDITLSAAVSCKTNCEQGNWLKEEQSSFSWPNGNTVSYSGGNDTPVTLELNADVIVNCNKEQGEANIVITGNDGATPSHANIGLNVQTFTPRFEEF